MEKLEEYKCLWDGSDPDWLLIRLNPDEPEDIARFVIYHESTKQGLIIEDDAFYFEVQNRMRKAGSRIQNLTQIKV